MELSDDDAYLVLNGLPHIGPVTLRRLLEAFEGSPTAILQASVKHLESIRDIGPVTAQTLVHWKDHIDLAAQHEKLKKSGVQFFSQDHENYPRLLREIYDAPIGLYWKGKPVRSQLCIGFVGTRRATLYGTTLARKLAGELARRGHCIVSGMARGIDTAAHVGALDAGGETVAVLGCGIDIVYPPENYELYKKIAETGAVVSEFPFGRRADKQTFPMRNRIIAGMCQGIVIVESGLQGGSMITARFAAEQGRQVFAVPGRIDQDSSRGCHALIREGVTLVTCVEDILEELDTGLQRELLFEEQNAMHKQEKSRKMHAELSPEEARVYELLNGASALSIDEVSTRLTTPPHEVARTLLMLELKQMAAKRIDGRYEILVAD